MVHSSMSPQLFEHAPKILSLTLPPSQTKQIPCALLKLEYLHLADSTPLAHSLKKQGGTPPSFPFRNSRIFFQSATTITTESTSTIDMECGAPAPLLTNNTSPPNLLIRRLPSVTPASSQASPQHPPPIHTPFTNLARSYRTIPFPP